jgi:hypothetical protein
LGRELTTARLAARSQYSAASTMSAFAAEFMGPLSFGGWCAGRQSAVCIRLLTLRSSHCENQIGPLRVKPGQSLPGGKERSTKREKGASSAVQACSGYRYSTPPPASNSSGMTPDRIRTSGGPQSPSSGSPVLDHAITANMRLRKPVRQCSRGSCGWARFRFKGHDAAFPLLECLHDVKGVRGHSRSSPSMETWPRPQRRVGSYTIPPPVRPRFPAHSRSGLVTAKRRCHLRRLPFGRPWVLRYSTSPARLRRRMVRLPINFSAAIVLRARHAT